MGIGTTADSLAAIEKIVFTDKKATLSDLKNALNSNFEGYGELQKDLLAAPNTEITTISLINTLFGLSTI